MLAISNIAWSPSERDAVFALLASQNVCGLEIAAGQTFPDEPDPFAPPPQAVSDFLRVCERSGLQLVSLQSLLSGVQDAQLFGTKAQRERFEGGLERAIRFAGRLGIPNLVMGAPGNRAIPSNVRREDAELDAIDTFRRLGDLCLAAGTRLALEPNAAAYGTNFLNTIGEALAFTKRVQHPSVCVNFDIGSLHMNGEMAHGADWFAKVGRLASHVHISEPNLAPAPADAAGLAVLVRGILSAGYDGWFSIEMRPVEEDNLANIGKSVAKCKEAFSLDAG